MMKKLLLIVLVLLVGAAFVFAGGSKETKPAAETKPAGETKPAVEKILVGMATDVGGLGDKSFNDGAYQGILKGQKDLGIEPRVVESKQMTDYVPNLSGLAEDGCKVVFAVGFLMAEAIMEAAKNNPDAKFAGIDIFIDPASSPKNVMGILYKEQESGYLAGVVAGLLTKEYYKASPRLNDKNVVGMVLGMDIPPVERYQAGFYAGVKSVNPDCEVLSVVTGSFTDQAKGKESAIAMIDKGADIIFQIAGLTGLGAINAADEKNVCAIGVDVDQFNVAPNAVITSAEKGIVNSVFLTIDSALKGSFMGGSSKEFGINEDATGISAFHNFDSVIPQAVKDKVKQTIVDMKAGKIKIPASRAEAGYKG